MDHPRGIQPFGNSFLSAVASIRDSGLGSLHVISDDILLDILGQLGAADLANLSLSSKSLYCFSTFEDIWKASVLEEFEGRFLWEASWKQTYVATLKARKAVPEPKQEEAVERKRPKKKQRSTQQGPHSCPPPPAQVLKVQGFYSDLLYQPWFCATVDLDPDWLAVDNIDRRSNLSVKQFIEEFERPNRPVVIKDAAAKWPAMKKWNLGYLAKAFAGQDIIAGNYEMPFDMYLKYCSHNQDESPLYLFDKKFCSRAPHLAEDFQVPPYFTDDLFSVLGEEHRPDYRWLIIGPTRSGSSFHVDPNSTSAWNAVVKGSKKWLLYPPHVVPPGVHPSPDGADVATPLSIVEWYLNFYQEAKEGKVKPIECIVREGELIFVPRGWWHMAINLEPSIAVTQNYVSRTSLPQVLTFLQPGRSDLVSGCSKEERSHMYERFVSALEKEKPDIIQLVEAERQAKRIKVEEQNKSQDKLCKLFKTKETAACTAAGPSATSTASASAFSFGFSL